MALAQANLPLTYNLGNTDLAMQTRNGEPSPMHFAQTASNAQLQAVMRGSSAFSQIPFAQAGMLGFPPYSLGPSPQAFDLLQAAATPHANHKSGNGKHLNSRKYPWHVWKQAFLSWCCTCKGTYFWFPKVASDTAQQECCIQYYVCQGVLHMYDWCHPIPEFFVKFIAEMLLLSPACSAIFEILSELDDLAKEIKGSMRSETEMVFQRANSQIALLSDTYWTDFE